VEKAKRGQKPGQRIGGRAAGTPNKSTIVKRLLAQHGTELATNVGILPLQVLLARMTGTPLPDGTLPTDKQVEAAQAAAPYIHPRLASTDTTIKSDNVHRVVAADPVAKEWVDEFANGIEPVTVANDVAA